MIKNSKELKVSKQDLEGFYRALESLKKKKDAMNPLEFKADENASLSLIEKTEREIGEYENLVSGEGCFITINSIHDLGKVLTQARVAREWTQEELGKKLGIDQQQIHRYEAFDYESIKWSRMLEVIDTLGIDIQYNKAFIKRPERKKSAEIEKQIERYSNTICEQGFFGKKEAA